VHPHRQKYPKQQPQNFRTPFYQPALSAIRDYYRSGNDPEVITAARDAAAKIKVDGRRANNLRVLDQFAKGKQYARALEPATKARVRAAFGDVELRLSNDLRALEDDEPRIVYYNCSVAPLDAETAKYTVEIAHIVLEESGIDVPIASIEFNDLKSDKSYRVVKRRATTAKLLKDNLKIIHALWPAL
jgi:hypothetical protein